MPNGDNIGLKSILVMSPIYMTSQSGALCISVTHFLGRQDFFFLVRESLTRIYEKCFVKLGWLLDAFKAQLAKWRKRSGPVNGIEN